MYKGILFVSSVLILCGCQDNSLTVAGGIKAPVYGECLKYLERYNAKMTKSYDVGLGVELFNVKEKIAGGVVGLIEITGSDGEFYFNGLRHLCYPKDFYKITRTDSGIEDVIRMSKGFKAADKEHYISVTDKTISIQYNGIEEHLKKDVLN